MELLVTSVVASIVCIALIATTVVFTRQYAISYARQDLTINAQDAVAVLRDDVRNSVAAIPYNYNADPNAPSTVESDYSTVAGNPDSSDASYNWRVGAGRLILLQPVRTNGNLPIYTDLTNFTGSYNVIVYYVRDGVLYRRLIAGQGNAENTLTCTPAEAPGGCTSGTTIDQKIVSGLYTYGDDPQGKTSFGVAYYDSSNNMITNLNTINALGGSGVSATKEVAISLKLGRTQAGQALVTVRDALVQMRSTASARVGGTDDTVYPAGMKIGAGGISLNNARLSSRKIMTQGPIQLTNTSKIGSYSQPSYVATTNKACGTGANYATQNCPTQPIVFGSPSWFYPTPSSIYGDVCARGLNAGTPNIYPGASGTSYTTGQISSCTPPDTTLPVIDKTAFTSSMTATKSGDAASCNAFTNWGIGNSIDANTKYTSNVAMTGCEIKLKGNAYIKGTFYINGNSVLRVDESVTRRPIVVVNRVVSVSTGATIIPNSRGITPMIVSYKSNQQSCGDSDTTCNLSNADLELSADTIAINLMGATAPGTIFYAYNAKTTVNINGTLYAGLLMARRVEASMGAQIIIDQ